jgi:SAM-dependent methyltransferase
LLKRLFIVYIFGMICRVCDAQDFSLALDLKEQPWGNHFLTAEEVGKEPFYPLRVVYCHRCQTAQLDFTVKKEVMFSNHTYLSGITHSLHTHFQKMAQEVDERFFKSKPKKSVLDIGSNDGTQLFYYQQLGYDVCGVESSKSIAGIACAKGIPTLHAFFNLSLAESLQPFDVINASGVFFHLEELHSVTEGIKLLLQEDGVFVVQFLYMKSILENGAFDQIYHEHLLYYTLKTIEMLLNCHGLALFDAYLAPIHGGSIMGFVSHQGKRAPSERLQKLRKQEEESECNELSTYLQFAETLAKLKQRDLAYLEKKKKEGKRVFGMGAPVKGNTLLNYFGIGREILDVLVEKNERRRGLFSPGTHIPIAIERELETPPDVYYVLAWNFKEEILKNNQALIDRGVEFYFPINPKE